MNGLNPEFVHHVQHFFRVEAEASVLSVMDPENWTGQ